MRVINPHRSAVPAGGLPPVSDGLVAWYPLQGDTLDHVGVAHGTLVGAGASITPTHLDLAGANTNALEFGDADWFSGVDSTFSVTAKVKFNSSADFRVLAKYGGSICSSDEREVLWTKISGKMRFRYASTLQFSAVVKTYGTDSISTGQTVNLCVTYDGALDTNNGRDRVVMYQDGAVDARSGGSESGTLSDIKDGTAYSAIGAVISPTGAACDAVKSNGEMSDFRVYNRVLTSTEVASIASGDG